MIKVHIIEDDRVFSRLIERALDNDSSFEITPFYNGADFLKRLSDNPNVVTLDLGLPDLAGSEIFTQIKKFNPEIEVIVISGQDDLKLAVQLLKQGAFDYIAKDENIKERLLHSIRNIKRNLELKNELSYLKTEISERYNYQKAIVGESNAIKQVLRLVDKAVNIPNVNVSLTGESGTGKELIAKTIHFNSLRKDSPFITVNVSTIAPEHIAVELFGYERTSNGAGFISRPGKLEEANEGTLFIEDANELELDMQVRLLKVLQDKTLVRVDGHRAIPINIRIITSTTHDLNEDVRESKFREDLFFRLKGIPIYLPPLKDRQKDIFILSKYFLNKFCEQNMLNTLELKPAARRKLINYNFPGNVRELKSVIELSAVLTNTGEIDEEHIIFNSASENLDLFSEDLTLKDYNKRIIKHFLAKYNSVVTVAQKLEIGKSTIYNLLKNDKDKSLEEYTN